jgi:secreted trypsin-like serine protease
MPLPTGAIIPRRRPDIFARYAGTTRLIEVKSTTNGDSHSAKFTNNPGRGGGTCFGDSGGPIFYGTTNIIGAITSFGHTPCIGVDFNFRIDTEIAQDFIQDHLD